MVGDSLGLLAGIFDHARAGVEPDREHSREQAETRPCEGARRWLGAGSAIGLSLWLASASASADPFRIATYAAPLSRDGPGLLLRDIVSGEDKAIAAIQEVISAADPDILLLTDFDHDAGVAALNAFADLLAKRGTVYPFRFALPSNAGLPTGFDLDGNGALGEARDAMGCGAFVATAGWRCCRACRSTQMGWPILQTSFCAICRVRSCRS